MGIFKGHRLSSFLANSGVRWGSRRGYSLWLKLTQWALPTECPPAHPTNQFSPSAMAVDLDYVQKLNTGEVLLVAIARMTIFDFGGFAHPSWPQPPQC